MQKVLTARSAPATLYETLYTKKCNLVRGQLQKTLYDHLVRQPCTQPCTRACIWLLTSGHIILHRAGRSRSPTQPPKVRMEPQRSFLPCTNLVRMAHTNASTEIIRTAPEERIYKPEFKSVRWDLRAGT